MLAVEPKGSHEEPIALRGWIGRGTRTEWGGFCFDSKAEAACAAFLVRFVPNFKIIPGETAQIDLGGAYADFSVNGRLVEYHPIRLFHERRGRNGSKGDFATREAFDRYRAARALLATAEEKRRFTDDVRSDLKARYAERRTALARAAFPGREIVFADSAAEFYLNVLVPAGTGLPHLKGFLQLFKSVIRGFH